MTHQSALTASGRLSPWARWLGFAGLAPQAILAAVVIAGPSSAASGARDLALIYAALILSFLGGAWWGLVSRSRTTVRGSIWLMAVAPSLLAFAALAAWAIARISVPSLVIIGSALIATLLFDRKLAANGLCPLGWLSLRTPLSLGLGGLTLFVALIP